MQCRLLGVDTLTHARETLRLELTLPAHAVRAVTLEGGTSAVGQAA